MGKTIKVPCKYCGVKILPITSEKNGGYCALHSYLKLPFRNQCGEIHTKLSEVDLKKEERVKSLLEWGTFREHLSKTNKLYEFGAIPSTKQRLLNNHNRKFAVSGYVIINEHEWIRGLVTKWIGTRTLP